MIKSEVRSGDKAKVYSGRNVTILCLFVCVCVCVCDCLSVWVLFFGNGSTIYTYSRKPIRKVF